MVNVRKSDIVAFSTSSKLELYSYLDRLQNVKYLTLQEQRNLILNNLNCLDLLEDVATQNEQNIAKINQVESLILSVESVEKIIQSSVYKFTQSWK